MANVDNGITLCVYLSDPLRNEPNLQTAREVEDYISILS